MILLYIKFKKNKKFRKSFKKLSKLILGKKGLEIQKYAQITSNILNVCFDRFSLNNEKLNCFKKYLSESYLNKSM